MKQQVSPVVVVVAVVLLVALVAGAYVKFSAPKGLPKGGAEVAQQRGQQMPQQPFIPKADGGKVEGPANMGGGSPGRPPVAQGAGLIPPGQGMPGAPAPGGARPGMGPQGGMPQQPFVPGQ